jgi:hypothetical protein
MSEAMTILEKAARALCVKDGLDPDELVYGHTTVRPVFPRWWFAYREGAETTLATLGLTPAMMQQPAGSLVVVPVEASETMLLRGMEAANDKRWAWCGYGPRTAGEGLDGMIFYVRDAYLAMLAARPGSGESAS